ncbi:MAG: hypothetical protein KF778_21135 [Rhodocyclaceae bacterium]|nr:hypothetical protein [Rhodocyclaceae bacterium]MBX3670910.1 hypothetical protein [Rhodocyclaceae bacterium]
MERNATLVLQADTAKDGWADAYECDNVPADATVIVPPDSPRYRALQPIPPLAGPALAPQTPAPSCRGGQWRVFSTFGDADLVFEYGPLGTGNAGGPPLALSLRIKYGASGLRARATQDDLPAEVEFQAGPEECLVRALYRGQFTLRLNFQRAE